MSGPIRSKLGPALAYLQKHIVTTSNLLKETLTSEVVSQLRAEKVHLVNLVNRIDSDNNQWWEYIQLLEGDVQAAEEVSRIEFAFKVRPFSL